MSQWVEDEIVLPNGPFVGERYRHHRHPVSQLWFDAIDSGMWSRFAATGPTQNGKTLMCYVAPVCYHLFEMGETVIVGLPSMDMANDKWQQDFRPVIEASDYRGLLPLKGEGSKGGQVKRSISFRNGATLRFMTAGGSDKQRAGYTARVVAITETDGMDEAGEASREADKIEQIEGRTRAFGRTGKRIYLECTTSIARGRIWQELKGGTDSRIARPCPKCGEYVTPEREHLIGWSECESEEEAAAKSLWSCPECGEAWSDADRVAGWKNAILVHAGQEVTPDGAVVGTPRQTQTLGFRWSAVDNPFITAGDLGAEEWRANRSADVENAEKKMRQFVFTLPYDPPEIDLTPLDQVEVRNRKGDYPRGMVPSCLGVCVAIDTGKARLHWVAQAVTTEGDMFVIDYGFVPTDADRLGVFKGLLEAFRKLRRHLEQGWQVSGGAIIKPSQVWIDSGWHEHTDAVYALCAEANQGCNRGGERYRPTKGYGEGQVRMGRYVAPSQKSLDVAFVGKEYHISRPRRNGKVVPGVLLVHMNSDHWKSEVHQRLSMPMGQTGSIRLFDSKNPNEHAEYAAHMTAEKQMEKFLPQRGSVIVWERINRKNHYLDAAYAVTTACDFLRVVKGFRTPARPVGVQTSGKGNIIERPGGWMPARRQH
jgi:phage terminase large subunit GpA-like protein